MNDRITRGGQIKVYLGKCFRIFRNEKGWKVLVSAAIIGLILSWVVGDKTFRLFESTKSGMFAMVCGCIWIGLFNSIVNLVMISLTNFISGRLTSSSLWPAHFLLHHCPCHL